MSACLWAQRQPPPTFNFGLASNFFFVYRTLSMRQKTKNHQNQGSIYKNLIFSPVPKSHTQMGSLSAKNEREKFSRLGTFNPSYSTLPHTRPSLLLDPPLYSTLPYTQTSLILNPTIYSTLPFLTRYGTRVRNTLLVAVQ